MQALFMDYNQLNDPYILYEVSQFVSLECLKIKNNPFPDEYDQNYIR